MLHKLIAPWFLFSVASWASFDIYIKESNQIPLYAQETDVWCGAASAQMMLEGFPDDINHVYKQSFVWDTIQPLKVEQGWYTDPDGLKRVMERLGGSDFWETRCSKENSAPLMKLILKNMRYQHYPVTVLVYGSAHWIVVVGATTDKDPATSEPIVLEKIEAHDPWKAQHVLVSGSTWFQKYWPRPARTRGKWSGCYVAIQRTLMETNKKPLGPLTFIRSAKSRVRLPDNELLKMAKAHISELTSLHPQFSRLRSANLLGPRFVSHASGEYTLIPLGDPKTGMSQGAVILNPYSGEWEGISQFGESVRYFTAKEARDSLNLGEKDQSEWIFSPSHESPSPFLPALRVSRSANSDAIYFDYDGRSSNKLTPFQPGS